MLIVLVSFITSTKILNDSWRHHRHHHKHHRHHSHHQAKHHKQNHKSHSRSNTVCGSHIRGGRFSQFIQAAIIQLSESNDSEQFMRKCFGRRQQANSPSNQSASQTEGHFKNSNGPLQKVLSFVGKVIKIVCKLKGLVIKILKKLCHSRRRRLFIAISNKRWKPFKKIKRFIKKAGRAIKKVAKAIGKGLNFLSQIVMKFVKKAWSAIKGFIKKLTSVFKSKPFLMFKNFLSCIIGGFGRMKKMRKNIIGFIRAVKQMTNMCGCIQVFVKAVCEWRRFYQAAQYLFKSKNARGNKKWCFLGSFLGGFAVAIAKSS